MIKIAGFKILEKIHESQKLAFFTACSNASPKTILIKVANTKDYNYLLETEYKISRNLNPEIILKPIEIKSNKGIKFLTFENFE